MPHFQIIHTIPIFRKKKEAVDRLYADYLPRGLTDTDITRPLSTAAKMPPAPAVSGPVSTPARPLSATALRVPSASSAPNPTMGTVTPAPAKR